MNYATLYRNLIHLCKTVSPKDRIERRNPKDERLITGKIYVEEHHILPRHSGGGNEKENLVMLLPEEHYLAHLLLWRRDNSRKDLLAVRIIRNGIKSNSMYGNLPLSVLRKVSSIRTHVHFFRKKGSWHTPEGLENISAAQRGFFNAVDQEGNKVRVRVDDPRVLSGELRHHTVGTKVVRCKETGKCKRIPCSDPIPDGYEEPHDRRGQKNGNFKKMEPWMVERIYEICRETSEEGHIKIGKAERQVGKEFKSLFHKPPGGRWIENHLGKDWMYHVPGVKYNPLHRSKTAHRKKKERKDVEENKAQLF